MLRALLLSLLSLLAVASPALAAGDLVNVVDPCEEFMICPIVRTELDPLRVCAGLGLGLQGAVVCAYERADGATCAFVQVGFHRHDVCDLLAPISLAVEPGVLP